MTKNEMIRYIYDAIIERGYEDDKTSEVIGTTRGKFENPIYVKKIHTPIDNIDSVAIASMDKTFEDACDSDVRIAYNDTMIGKRVFIWANECTKEMLFEIYKYLNS